MHRELPGLRGFSATNMKFMRLFYEAWSELDANSSAVVDELQISNSEPNTNSSAMADDLEVPLFSFLHNSGFLDVPFTHHTIILSKVKDVDHFLLKGKQPVIMVIARQMYKTLPQELQKPLDDGRLLIISTAPTATRVGKTAADQRNAYIAEIADSIVFGYIRPESSLQEIFNQHPNKSTILCHD